MQVLEQPRLGLDHAAAHQDPPGRGGEHQGVQQLRQRVCRRVSHAGSCGGTSWAGNPARAAIAAPGGEPLDAVAVEGTGSAPVVARLTRDANVAELGMAEAVHQASAGNQPDADSGTDGDVGEILEDGPAPQRPSASAAPFTSVSKTTGTPIAPASRPTIPVSHQPGFEVDVMDP